MNEGDRIYMMEIMSQMRQVRDRIEENTKEAELWEKRVGLANRSGDGGLAAEAQRRADDARESILADEKVLMELEVQKSTLKGQIRVGDPGAVSRAQKMVESLKDTPWDPRDAKIDRLAKEANADDMLAALKKKMD